LNLGDLCENGSQLRPHIVWFGEPVTMIEPAIEITASADYFVVIGTSLVVYPAAGLLGYVKPDITKYYLDPRAFQVEGINNLKVIQQSAGKGVPALVEELLALD